MTNLRKSLRGSTSATARPEGINAKVDIEAYPNARGSNQRQGGLHEVCFACHKAGNIGIDYGPALTEIGSKLPKSELYLAIIDPNAG